MSTKLNVAVADNNLGKKSSSKAVYENLEKNTDIEYVLNATGVKENIVIKELSSAYRYSFALKTEGLKLRLSQDNESLELYSENIGEDGKMGLENISQSDRIGQDSTVVLGLDQKNDVLSIHLLKARDSERGITLKYALDFDKGTYTFIPNENDGNDTDTYDAVRDRYSTTNSDEVNYESDEF